MLLFSIASIYSMGGLWASTEQTRRWFVGWYGFGRGVQGLQTKTTVDEMYTSLAIRNLQWPDGSGPNSSPFHKSI